MVELTDEDDALLTELGVERIVPVIARRTEKHLAQAAATRVERWRRIAREAAQQSRRSQELAMSDAMQLKEVIAEEPEAIRLLLSENEQNTTLRDALNASGSISANSDFRRVRLAIGPEGGWTSEEEALFADQNWKPVTLGPRILRAETAAIAAASVVSALLD